MGMKQSPKGEALTKGREGLRLKAYNDNPKNPQKGKWTIGWGHTRGVVEGMECTEAQAEVWYRQDMSVAEHDVQLYVTVPLTQGQFDALVDWTFNLGGENLRSSSMLRFLNNKDFSQALQELRRWDHMGKVVVEGLTARRQEEINLWKGVV